MPDVVTLSLQGRCDRHREASAEYDLSLERQNSMRQILIDAKGLQHIVFQKGQSVLPVVLDGCAISIGPFRVTFQVQGIANLDRVCESFAELNTILSAIARPGAALRGRMTRDLQMRDALIALDGHRVGASYRDISEVIFGSERTREGWRSSSTALKDRIRRALKRGLWLAGGGYRQLL